MPDLPKWKDYIQGVGRTSLDLRLRDEHELRFVCAVIARAFEQVTWGKVKMRLARDTLTYFTGVESGAFPIRRHLCEEFDVACPPEPIATVSLPDGRLLRFIDLATPGVDPGSTEVRAAIDAQAIKFVSGAERLAGPVPKDSFEFRIDAREKPTKRKPYFCHVEVTSYGGGSPFPITLSPKWWSVHPAYPALKAARAAPPASGSQAS